MHETNKIELKLIEVDARSYLGLFQVTSVCMGLCLFIYYLAFRRENDSFLINVHYFHQ